MPAETTKRFDRIMHIFIQLQSKRIVKAKELAERFDVSLRTIYRDIKSLELAGVPIYGEAGTGYGIVDGYRMPPISFTKEDVMGIVGAEKLMEKFVDKTLASHFKSAMFKIKAVLRMNEKDWAQIIESQIVMRNHHNPPFNIEVPDALSTLFESIAQQKKIRMLYQGLQDKSPKERILESVGLFHQSNYWYVQAFCHGRQAYRQFRLDRISQVQLLTESYEIDHPPLEELLQESPKSPLIEVKILVQRTMAHHLQWDRKYYGFIAEEDLGENIEMTFHSPDIEEEFPRWFAMFADCAKIIQPDVLRTRINEHLQAGLANARP